MADMGIVRSKYYGIMRGITVGISFFLQIALMIFLGMYLMRYSIIVYFVLELVSVIIDRKSVVRERVCLYV